MPDPNANALFDAFAEELLAERAIRPLVIVGASKVDYLLREVVRGFLLPKIASAREQDELLEGDSPLSTFSARIKVCRRLGLIDESLYRTLEQLRALRNLSAHSISFQPMDSPARDHIAELRRRIAGRRSFRLTKNRYFDDLPPDPVEELQCLLLTLCVLLEAIRGRIAPTRGDNDALAIAAR